MKRLNEGKQLLLVDIDGTLCDRNNKIPLSASEAIKKVRSNGHLVYLVTGRALAEIYQDAYDMGFDGIIGGNGSYVMCDNKMIFQKVIEKDVLDKLISWMEDNEIGYYLECNSGLYGNKYLKEKVAKMLFKDNISDAKAWLHKYFPDMIYDYEQDPSDVNKISFVLDDPNELSEAHALFDDIVKVGSWGVFTGDRFGEFALNNIDKDSSIEMLLKHLGMDWDHTIVFGDNNVDVMMITKAHIGVAMGNGRDIVKQASDFVTKDVDDNGLAYAIEQIGL